MAVQWEDRLLKASFRQAREWAGENPIKYSVIFGAPAVILQVAIFAGVLRISDVLGAIVSLIVVPVAIVLFMIVRTLLVMLYEVREALGQHLDPTVENGDPTNFSCELTNVNSKEIAVRITNHEAAGYFHAKVVDLQGVERSPVPISVRWRSDQSAPSRRINKGDSEVLTVVRIRGRRAVDFLQPLSINEDGYQRVTALNGNEAPGPPSVAATIRVFNQRDDTEGRRTHLLKMTFDNGGDTPTSNLQTLVDRD